MIATGLNDRTSEPRIKDSRTSVRFLTSPDSALHHIRRNLLHPINVFTALAILLLASIQSISRVECNSPGLS
jgi:hypothetical protein